MDDFEDTLEEVESGYLQLLRFSDEVERELSKKEMLVQESYRKYIVESATIKERWKASITKDDHFYHTQKAKEEVFFRIEGVKKKIMRNIEAIEVRLRHLDPVNQYINKVKLNIQKFKHYSSKKENKEELERVKKNLEFLLLEKMDESEAQKAKEEIKKILTDS